MSKPIQSTELCMRCGRVQPCTATSMAGGTMYRCAVCGQQLGFDLADDYDWDGPEADEAAESIVDQFMDPIPIMERDGGGRQLSAEDEAAMRKAGNDFLDGMEGD